MKTHWNRIGTTLACCLLLTVAHAESQPAGFVDFGKLAPSATAEQFVEVNVKGALLKLAAQFTRKEEPEVAELIASIQQVRVNVVGLGDDNRADVTSRLGAMRGELEGKGWERVVNAREKAQDVSVYLKLGGGEVVEGVVVTVIDGGREAVLVNVVGNVKVDQIAKLGEKLNIEPLKKVGEAVRTNGTGTPAADKK